MLFQLKVLYIYIYIYIYIFPIYTHYDNSGCRVEELLPRLTDLTWLQLWWCNDNNTNNNDDVAFSLLIYVFEGYDGGSSDSECESPTLDEQECQSALMPDFWLIVKIYQDRVKVYSHSRSDKP